MLDPVLRAPQYPKSWVIVSPPTLSGGNVPDAERVVSGMRMRFQACYEVGLLNNALQSAKVHVEAMLSDRGAVGRMKVDRATVSTRASPHASSAA
jgi:hypothetical protein